MTAARRPAARRPAARRPAATQVAARRSDPDAADERRSEPPDAATAPLTAPSILTHLLRRHGLRADKRFGQHFLIDPSVTLAVVDAAQVRADDQVWEVGPGVGVLTRALAGRAREVVAVEVDRRLLPLLDETLAGSANVRILCQDALQVDFGQAEPGSCFAANLPYNVGTAVLVRVVTSGRFDRVGVLLQREVAERLVATPGTAAYGSLSLLIAHHGRATIVRRVAPGAFLPEPAVTSAVVRIELDEGVAPDPATFAVVRAGFRHRRKTLRANLRLAGVQDDIIEAALGVLGLDPRVRAEALDLDTFRALAAHLPAMGPPNGTST